MLTVPLPATAIFAAWPTRKTLLPLLAKIRLLPSPATIVVSVSGAPT
jgi:hypothetical protein